MAKILEINDCSECKYCGGGVMLEAYCGHDKVIGTGKFQNYPEIPWWCPLKDSKQEAVK